MKLIRLAALLTVAATMLPASRAADVEVREFATFLDGRRVGDYRMTITPQQQGGVVMTAHAQMRIALPQGSAAYEYRGSEVVQAGRLLRLDSTSGDEKRQSKTSVIDDADGYRINADGKERVVGGPVWTTTYWTLPAADVRSTPLTLIDADNGRDFQGNLERLGTGQVIVDGKPMTCTRYRLTGPTPVDLWYDDADRLVRQEWRQEGRRVVLQLAKIKR